MNKLTDEILNKYIDGELESFELAEIKSLIEKDDEAVKRLRALRLIDESLKQIEVDLAPSNFTEKLMDLISQKTKTIKPKINYFFFSIVSLLSIGVLAVIASAVNSTNQQTGEQAVNPYVQQTKDFLVKNLDILKDFFGNQTVMLIGSFLTFVLLIGVYFTFETHKNFKKKLNSIS